MTSALGAGANGPLLQRRRRLYHSDVTHKLLRISDRRRDAVSQRPDLLPLLRHLRRVHLPLAPHPIRRLPGVSFIKHFYSSLMVRQK